jgi:tetratricopeptide (TPR) repeat protein
VRLDRELKVIENSGHAKIGVFAKPLGDQQRCRMMAVAVTQDTTRHLPEDPLAAEPAFVDDDDVTSDPFFHRFYDDAGRSTYEQLLRARMRVLALAKMVHSRESVGYVRAEVELAETYARMNLWKQAHTHVMVGHEILKALDDGRAMRQRETQQMLDLDDDSKDDTVGRVLEFFYSQQLLGGLQAGEITRAKLTEEALRWHSQPARTDDGDTPHTPSALAAILSPSNIDVFFGTASSLHWQQLLLCLERQSVLFQDHLRIAESRIPEPTRCFLRESFTQMDPSQFGTVSLRSLIDQLESTSIHDDIVRVCEALRCHDLRIEYPSVSWSEIVQLAWACLSPPPEGTSAGIADHHDPARDLRPRLKFLLGRFFLRKGQLDDAMRYMQTAIAEHEQVHGPDSESLVILYLTMAETLSVRSKQLTVVAQQNAFAAATKWLATTDGSRRLRAKALELIDLASHHNQRRDKSSALPSKKEAEAQAREELLKEFAALSLVRPDATAVEDAIEFCTKAWRIQEATHGRDHITTANVHATLAQIHATSHNYDECLRCYEQAIAMYEASCNGPVPASVWLQLTIAKIYHHEMGRPTEAATLYDHVGDFFHSFALEFASSDATRRESCTQAIEAWRQWLVVASGTMDDEKRIVAKIHDATVNGFGEFAVEAAESGRDLARLLIKMGHLRHAERHLRTAWYVLESHFGPNDRQSRKARKELMELSSEIKGAALDEDDSGHEWLTI